MNKVNTTKRFRDWLYNLKDMHAKTKILRRIERAKNNNLGDYKQLAENLFEMRIFEGPGYRVYYTMQDKTIYLLLIGGDKSSQSKDIEIAKKMLTQLEDEL